MTYRTFEQWGKLPEGTARPFAGLSEFHFFCFNQKLRVRLHTSLKMFHGKQQFLHVCNFVCGHSSWGQPGVSE